MKLSYEMLTRIEADLGLNIPFVKGQEKNIKNCWHFSTDGNAVDSMFYDEQDFKDGMNRVYIVVMCYNVIILAFSLMDTHIHFILYGTLEDCNRFIHDYVRRTSRHISVRHGDKHKLEAVPIHYQKVATESYLKTVICYTIKNAPVGGIPFCGFDYPWSSGPLYFRKKGYWSTPRWMDQTAETTMSFRTQRDILKARVHGARRHRMVDDIIFPGEYVAYEIVERLFKSHKAFLFFICKSREIDVDAEEGILSHLSIPIQEMRQRRTEMCEEMFGCRSLRGLSTTKRILLAKTLRRRYNCSRKQIARISGLVYAEVKDLI